MTQLNLEQEIFTIISHGGNARSLAYEAIDFANQNEFKKADESMVKAQQELNKAHQTQTKLIQAEINGVVVEKSLLMIHAQDHLMTAVSELSLIEQMIKLIKKIAQLSK